MSRKARWGAESLLANVTEEQVFKCCDGRTLRNMQELGYAFLTMTDETFAFHSSRERNDFGNWVRGTIGDEKLARDIERSLNRIQAARNVVQRVPFMGSRLI